MLSAAEIISLNLLFAISCSIAWLYASTSCTFKPIWAISPCSSWKGAWSFFTSIDPQVVWMLFTSPWIDVCKLVWLASKLALSFSSVLRVSLISPSSLSFSALAFLMACPSCSTDSSRVFLDSSRAVKIIVFNSKFRYYPIFQKKKY